ncbi:hypothetical protein NC653_005905 [Populus alba x Populus x berolinensis]|uniref:Uncharacterized protein n=1 Tax=Populus alba x Populus x berolinensis TaxID=444605 RepID=A0AAD6REC0_9ROSI|nr:hypothetical protein NC653_005905 [Populus alba x Populus x berolinensis]
MGSWRVGGDVSFWRLSDGNAASSTDHAGDVKETDRFDEQGQTAKYDDHLTPAGKSDISSNGKNLISRGWPANLIAGIQ